MLFDPYRSSLERLRFVLKPAITFEFWSTLIFMVSFVPASGWLFSIPILVFEGATPLGALKRSWRHTKGRFWKLAVPFAVWWAVVLISSAVTTWLVRAVAAQPLAHIGYTLKVVIPLVVVTLALISAIILVLIGLFGFVAVLL